MKYGGRPGPCRPPAGGAQSPHPTTGAGPRRGATAMMRRDQGGRRNGLGRVEVLVLGLFALVGLGLLITLLMRGREASDRVQCAEHLRRLGVAVREYHKSAGALPPARVAERHATWA